MSEDIKLTRDLVEKLFGNLDAEQDSADEFNKNFVEDEKFSSFNTDQPFKIVVGNKGTGKSAFLRRYYEIRNNDKNFVGINLDPPSIFTKMGNLPQSAVEANAAWRKFFADQAAIAILSDRVSSFLPQSGSDAGFSAAAGFFSWLKKISSIATVGGSDLIFEHGRNLDDIKNITFLIDDLDKGWSGRPNELHFVSTLINAAFDISRKEPRVKFRISLRWDIYDTISRNNSDTDRIRNQIVPLSWSSHQVYIIVANRISNVLGREFNASHILKSDIKQNEISKFYDPVIDRRFQGQGKWENTSTRHVLISLIRRRPRDLLSLLYIASNKALSSYKNKIDSDCLDKAIVSFSQDKLKGIFSEYSFRLENLDKLIYYFRPTGSARKFAEVYRYTNDSLNKKISEFKKGGFKLKFSGESYEADNYRIVEFLYRIEFLQAYHISGENMKRFDFEYQSDVFFGNEDVGMSWEVLPAYRWALKPTDHRNVYETLD